MADDFADHMVGLAGRLQHVIGIRFGFRAGP